MTLVVNPKNKQQEKIIKVFMQSLDINFHSEEEAALAIRIDQIKTDKRTYLLKGFQSFPITRPNKKSFAIESKLLDIYANGSSVAEASVDFYDQFDYTYQRLTNIEDKKLSKHLLEAKKFITLLVDQVKEK